LISSFHWSKNQVKRLKVDQERAIGVSPFVNDHIKSPIAAHFVNFHWLATPYNANTKILAVKVAQA